MPIRNSVGGLVQIGIAEYNRRGLAAQLESQFLEIAGRRLDDAPSRRGRTGERDFVHSGMLGECLSDRDAWAGDDVYGPRRQSRLEQQLAETQDGQGGLLRWLEDHAATGRKPGASFQEMASGPFHGTISTATPNGSRRT